MTRRYDAVAVLQLLGAPAILVGLWLLLAYADFPTIAASVNVAVSALLAVAGFALVVFGWVRFGGYGQYQALRRWIRDGPEPIQVPILTRLRFLRQQPDGSWAGGWFYLALAVLWLGLAIPELVNGQRSAAVYVATAALWTVGGTFRILFVRHWGVRVQQLTERTEANLNDSDSADTDSFR